MAYAAVEATIYYDSKFNSVNLPLNENVLESATTQTRTFDVMEINQIYYLSSVRIKVNSESDLIGANYLKLSRPSGYDGAGKVYYSIVSYRMTSLDVCELSIVMDTWLTMGGIDGITECLDGMAIRTSKPAIATNALTDPMLIPHYPLVAFTGNIDGSISNGMAWRSSGGVVNHQDMTAVVVATTDLSSLSNLSDQLEDNRALSVLNGLIEATSEQGDVVSSIANKIIIDTSPTYFHPNCRIRIWDGVFPGAGEDLNYMQTTDNSGGYFYYDRVFNSFDVLRSFGAEDSIVASYMPGGRSIVTENDLGDEQVYATKIYEMEGGAQHINGANASEYKVDYTSSDGYTEACAGIELEHAPKYLKTLLGPYNKYVLSAMATGNVREVLPEQLFSSNLESSLARDQGPGIWMLSDPRPNGKPVFNIRTKDITSIHENGVSGATWKDNPIVFTGKSGEAITQALFKSQQDYKDFTSSIQYQDVYGQDSANPIMLGLRNLKRGAMETAAQMMGQFRSDVVNAGRNGLGALNYNNYYQTAAEKEEMHARWQDPSYKAQMIRQYEARQEREQFMIENAVTVPEIRFSSGGEDATGNGALLVKIGLDPRDIALFDRIQEQFGTYTTEPLTKSMLTTDSDHPFVYVEAKGASFKYASSANMMGDMEADVAKLFSGGVRIWNRNPDITYYNPYRNG